MWTVSLAHSPGCTMSGHLPVYCSAILPIVLLLSGCGGGVTPPVEPAAFADLSGLKATHNKALQAEYARLVSEKATPLALKPASSSSPAAKEAAEAYNALFPADKLPLLEEEILKIYPFAANQPGDVLQAQKAFKLQWNGQRKKAVEAWRGAYSPVFIDLADGILAPLTPISVTQIAVTLQGCYVREQLDAGELQAAADGWMAAMRGIELLAELPHLTARLTAAQLRAECLQMLPELASHPATGPALRRKLEATLEGQLANWPPDSRAWIGDRALGLHLYEMVRDNHILSILSASDLAMLKKRRQLDAVVEAVEVNIDEDQYFYLIQMRKMINACSKPYYQRKDELDEILLTVARFKGVPSERYVAAHILLLQLDDAHKQQAQDRERCERHRLLLRQQRGAEAQPAVISPVTGKPILPQVASAFLPR